MFAGASCCDWRWIGFLFFAILVASKNKLTSNFSILTRWLKSPNTSPGAQEFKNSCIHNRRGNAHGQYVIHTRYCTTVCPRTQPHVGSPYGGNNNKRQLLVYCKQCSSFKKASRKLFLFNSVWPVLFFCRNCFFPSAISIAIHHQFFIVGLIHRCQLKCAAFLRITVSKWSTCNPHCIAFIFFTS